VRHAWLVILLAGCGAAAPPPSLRSTALDPVTVTEPADPPISGTTIGPAGRATPFGVSGGDPIAQLVGPTADPTYAFTPENPARVGGFGDDSNPESGEQSFLNALWGPQGQPIYYQRIGSCCPQGDFGMLDAFAVTYPGLEGEALVLYLDVYHRDDLRVPVGLRGGAPVSDPDRAP
jgi:hypothetical protein